MLSRFNRAFLFGSTRNLSLLIASKSAILQPTSETRNTSMDEMPHEWLERLAKAWPKNMSR